MINDGHLIAAPYIGLFARYFIGLILLIAGTTKLLGGGRFAEIVRGYQLLPEPLISSFARLLPISEVLVGTSLLLGVFLGWAAGAALCLFLLFGGAILINLLRGRRYISCGCFGPTKSGRLNWQLVGRNVCLGGVAILAMPAWEPAGRLQSLASAEMGFTFMSAAAAIACWWLSGVMLDIARLPNPLAALEHSHRHD